MRRPYHFKQINAHIVCKDGCTISVQASHTHYCTPRDDFGPYTHVEIGYPTMPIPESWAEYADTGDINTSDVFGYVPVTMVQELIDAHGGVDISAMLNKAGDSEKAYRKDHPEKEYL